MNIRFKLSQKDFINANLVLLYSKPAMKFLTGIFVFFLLTSIVTASLMPDVSFTQIIVPLSMLTILPLITYINARKNFNANSRFNESIEYIFDKEFLSIKGESFNSQYTWDKVFKVTQTKNWILIWQTKQVANPIPRSAVKEEEIIYLKEILQTHKVKNNF